MAINIPSPLGYPGVRYDEARKRMQELLNSAPTNAKARSDLIIASEATGVLHFLQRAHQGLAPLRGIAAVDEARTLMWNAICHLTEDLAGYPEAVGAMPADAPSAER